ncbi:tetratricopeptide repeat protein [uncultured Pseudodesulfovibrio sp.]|uniref:tetratricopeptide repeat protein n=1 Tax=uncultured Pseudodesulfovibrio sp. TaxID=2035858 RepID=UPI003748113C
MTVKSDKKIFWTVVTVLFTGLILVNPAHALRVNFQSLGDSDKLTFSFDSGGLPDVSVVRTGTQELTVSLPSGIWGKEAKPGMKTFPGKLVESIVSTDKGVTLKTRTSGFGYIRLPIPGKPAFMLQIFRDPIGARWKPAKDRPKPSPKPVPKAASKPLPETAPEAKSTPVSTPPKQVVQATTPVAPSEGKPAIPNANGEKKPFFAVPYSVRNEVAAPDAPTSQMTEKPQSAMPVEATLPAEPVQQIQPNAPEPPREVETGVYPPSNALRFRAVNQTAEQVKFAELAGDNAGRSPIVGAGQGTGTSQPSQAGSTVVRPSEVSGAGQVGNAVTPPPTELSGQGQTGGAVSPPPTPVQPAEISGQGQVGGAVTPPPMVVEGAPPPAPTPEETAQVEQTLEASQAEQAKREDVVSSETAQAEQPAPVVEGEQTAQPDGEGTQQPELTPEEQAKAHEEEIRNQLYEAQSLMFNGSLAAALPIYEGILKQPNVPDDVREETLYAVADIKKQLNSDNLSGKFDEVAQAFIEAMNANLRSSRVPRALLNLGLLNLQVGNFPEARAYFKILQEKYPDDDNIPSISYYWGEYYYKKGEFKKAADQFQYLIQTYPEHQLVKQAAYYLADSLNRTGFLDQAYQIVDYIDKRWPDYYMENMEFLRLAGSVEMELKKWQAAKNHYFTYYNLNPDADGADVVLARIGDIYIRLGLKEPAKQIYEKVVSNYPDEEGGLIAKMRLAEEGIYDDPAMHEMVDVFDRPYNLNPQRVYKEIVAKHPDSPLAPIAQLKLAMWYAFNKKYPEALTAAQDLIENYPDSPLVEKTKKLGDSVFVLAVPGMLGEERYARVVRYWETYDFIGKEGSKVDDKTKLAIATSYWKIGQPEKALELIEPFLQEKQIPGVSDDALGLAVNIHLDQLNWKKIADLVTMAKKNWKLKPAQQKQLEYARAMSMQNLGNVKEAMPMWAELAKDASVDPAFRAYAMYYMAKDAMQRQDLRRVFVYAQEALSLLLQTDGDPEKIKDTVLMSIYATERSGRYDEALKWAKEYDRYIEVDNPEWASTRFKLARIYRKAGAMEEWKQLLGDIIEKKPDTLQAQLAKSALDTYELEQKASKYQPVP